MVSPVKVECLDLPGVGAEEVLRAARRGQVRVVTTVLGHLL